METACICFKYRPLGFFLVAEGGLFASLRDPLRGCLRRKNPGLFFAQPGFFGEDYFASLRDPQLTLPEVV